MKENQEKEILEFLEKNQYAFKNGVLEIQKLAFPSP